MELRSTVMISSRKPKADYGVTGTVRSVGGYLDVSVELYSDWEERVLSQWSGEGYGATARMLLQEFDGAHQQARIGDFAVVVKANHERAVRRGDPVVPCRTGALADVVPDNTDLVGARDHLV